MNKPKLNLWSPDCSVHAFWDKASKSYFVSTKTKHGQTKVFAKDRNVAQRLFDDAVKFKSRGIHAV